MAPLLEKLLSDGTIVEYEIDTMNEHTASPGTFWIVIVVNDPAGIDKVDDAIRAAVKAHPLQGAAFGSLTDASAHRDELTNANSPTCYVAKRR